MAHRLGNVSGDATAVRPYIEGIHRLLRSRLCANHPEQYAIKPALEGPQTIWPRSSANCAHARPHRGVVQFDAPRELRFAPGSVLRVSPSWRTIPEGDDVFVKELLLQKHVLVVHGSGFGQKPGHQARPHRLSSGEQTLTTAYAAIADFMKKRYK